MFEPGALVRVVATPGRLEPVAIPPGSSVGIESCVYLKKPLNLGLKM